MSLLCVSLSFRHPGGEICVSATTPSPTYHTEPNGLYLCQVGLRVGVVAYLACAFPLFSVCVRLAFTSTYRFGAMI
jgi:hypothetical protein